ncbi:MAG: choice-of-anchor B family protein [Bacteroidota bacterium]
MRSLLILSLVAINLYLYAQDEPQELELLSHWEDSTLVGSFFFDNTYNEVWGIERNGHEYAIIGSTAGTHFIDMTDPKNPVEAFFIKGNESGNRIIHRDYHDLGDYLYAAADEGNSTLQIIDLSKLPEEIKVVYDSANLFNRTHNLFIDESQQRLYTFATSGGGLSYSPLRIYDLSKSPRIELVAAFSVFGGVRVGHVHDGYVQDNIAYLNCGNDGFFIIDFTDVLDPQVIDYLSTSNYPESGYNHSGWLGSDCNHYYMADETWGKPMKVVDVSTPGEAEVISLFDADSDSPFSIPHNQVVACDYLYASYYYDGLQIYDLSDPKNPMRVAYFSTSKKDHRDNYEGAWGVYPFLPSGNILVSDMQTGLFILKGIEDSCNATASSINCEDSTTSTKESRAENRLKIYPQPSNTTINVELPNPQQIELLRLFNLQGQLVQTWQIDGMTQTIELPLHRTLPNGIYNLVLNNNKAQRVIIMR